MQPVEVNSCVASKAQLNAQLVQLLAEERELGNEALAKGETARRSGVPCNTPIVSRWPMVGQPVVGFWLITAGTPSLAHALPHACTLAICDGRNKIVLAATLHGPWGLHTKA